jgi:hypothetical protein
VIAEFYRPAPPSEEVAAPPGPPPAPGTAPRPKPPPEILGRARWEGNRVVVEATGDVEAALLRVFRLTAVSAEDPAQRSKGSSGPSVIQPGSLEWFRWAAQARAADEGLEVRLVASGDPGGWDPAANYRPFREQVRRLQS